ncbi:amidophosphoribosyltransferase [Planctomycetales bacterium]|nr:amidophosphoribosyltransferase [Planctomycetales bacterium]
MTPKTVENIRRLFTAPFGRVLDLLCPAICTVCGQVSESGHIICPKCAEKIVTPQEHLCPRCGAKRNAGQVNVPDCVRCRYSQFRFRKAIALGDYETDLRDIVLRMKTGKSGMLATAVANMLVKYRLQEMLDANADLVIPVPMHWQRYRLRGVNSPDFLAREIARHLKLPVALATVQRIGYTVEQHKLHFEQRKENVADAFYLPPPSWFYSVKSVAGKRILLVDDILTSAATCNEVTKTLMSNKAKSVTVVTVARAGVALLSAGGL